MEMNCMNELNPWIEKFLIIRAYADIIGLCVGSLAIIGIIICLVCRKVK